MKRWIGTSLALVLLANVGVAAAPKLPAEKELKALALDSLLSFNKSVLAKDFTGFRAQISKLWQEQTTPAELAGIFKTFIDQQIDISFLAKADPVFDAPPKINGDDLLILEGHYATSPHSVEFRLKYVYEKPAWKLLGIKLNVNPVPAKVPPAGEVRKLVLDSLGIFNRAIQEKNFASLHQQIASVWREQTTPEKLQAIFQSFIDREVDLAPVLKSEPIFDEPPAINDNGLLEVKGSFQTKPDKVMFDLAYLYQAPDWKLMKINVKIGKAEEETPKEE